MGWKKKGLWLVRTLILQNHRYTLQWWGQIESKGAFSYPAVFSRDILSSVVLKKQIECLKNFVKTLIHRNKYAPSERFSSHCAVTIEHKSD